MTEIDIIRSRPLSFYGRALGSFFAAVVAGFAALQDKPLGEVPGMTWIVVIGGAVVQMCIAVNAWFSTSASKAREEISGK